jgi:hypothetical protein
MRVHRRAALRLLVAAFASGADRKMPPRTNRNDSAEISATAFLDRESIRSLLDTDLDGHYVIVEVHLTPQLKPIKVRRDDFVLRTDKDGERSTPFAPSQIAGASALVITQADGGVQASNGRGPSIGGHRIGGRKRKPADDSATAGKPAEPVAPAASPSSDQDKLIDTLKQKALPEKETDAPVSGLLYFPLEKQKLKDLELIYTTPDGKLNLRFR